MMIEINLLPWRMIQRERKKKIIRRVMMSGVLILVILGWILYHVYTHASPKEKQTPVNRSEKILHKQHQNISMSSLNSSQAMSLDLKNIHLQEALRLLANRLHHNIILSDQISGTTSLSFFHASAEEAFDSLLLSHELIKKNMGQAWFVAPSKEWVERQQESSKLQMVLDDAEPLMSKIWQIHFAKAEEIGKLLHDGTDSLLSKRGHVRVDNRTNVVYVQDTMRHLKTIAQLIQRVDVPVRQILIEARLASIDSDFEQNLGIHFSVQKRTDEKGSVFNAPSFLHYSVAVARLADGSLLDVQLAALENEGHGELISSPRLFTANQQTASIEAGEEIPYQEISQSGSTAVSFKKAVLSLKVTPQIMPNHGILLQLQVNQDRPSNRIVLGVPAINTRQISTNVLVKDGQTIVLGGIYESNQEQSERRVPFLGKIPLLGWLFKQQNIAENKRELLIFVTPKIIPEFGLT